MSFDLNLSTAQDAQPLSPQQQKLKSLIEKIEQQKIDLDMLEHAKTDIQQHARKTLMPAYVQWYSVLFEQLETLWESLHRHAFSKADLAQLDDKIYSLAQDLKDSQSLTENQLSKVDELHTFYDQHQAQYHSQFQRKIKSKKKDRANHTANHDAQSDYEQTEQLDNIAFDEIEEIEEIEEMTNWDAEQHIEARAQAKLKRQQDKQAQAQKMAEQSLKMVYLKIAAIIHPDREQDEVKKLEKTEMLQQANQAYENKDLFYLLKLQIQVDQARGIAKKGLSPDQIKFYKLALDAQSQKLDDQIDEVLESLYWTKKAKASGRRQSSGCVQVANLYKQIDADTSLIKQQIKAETERLKYMKRLSGLEMLLEHVAL